MAPPGQRENTRDPADTKPRGANRSTKVAGKLKVLPEQPEDLQIGGKSPAHIFKPPKDHTESAGNTGDSDDGDVEENDDSQEYDVEVCHRMQAAALQARRFFVQSVLTLRCTARSTIKYRSFPKEQHAGML